MREISNQEGNRLLRIVRRNSGSVVTWRRAQMVLLSAQAMDISQIARVTFTSPDRVRDVLHNFNLEGFDSLYPRYGRRSAAHLHPGPAAPDQAGRPQPTSGSRPTVLDLVVGGLLLGRLVEAARPAGLRWLTGKVLANDHRMLNLLRHSGWAVRLRPSCGVVLVEVSTWSSPDSRIVPAT